MLGILPYAGLDIAAFELMHDRLQAAYGDPAAVPPAALLVAGMLSSTGAQLVAYPLGFVRTRLQARARSPALPLACQPLAFRAPQCLPLMTESAACPEAEGALSQCCCLLSVPPLPDCACSLA